MKTANRHTHRQSTCVYWYSTIRIGFRCLVPSVMLSRLCIKHAHWWWWRWWCYARSLTHVPTLKSIPRLVSAQRIRRYTVVDNAKDSQTHIRQENIAVESLLSVLRATVYSRCSPLYMQSTNNVLCLPKIYTNIQLGTRSNKWWQRQRRRHNGGNGCGSDGGIWTIRIPNKFELHSVCMCVCVCISVRCV